MRWKVLTENGMYRVSDTGVVESRYSGEWKALKTTFGTKYPRVALYRRGVRTERQVHDLVLVEFVGPKPENSEVCHWNGDHQDNRLENLRYGDHIENAKDRLRHGSTSVRRGSKNTQAKLTEEDIASVRKLLSTGMTHREIAKRYNVSRSCISMVNTGRAWGTN